MANKRSPVLPMTQELKLELERLSRQRSLPAGLLCRIQIVLNGAAGKSNYGISNEMGISQAKVKRWRKRWSEEFKELSQLSKEKDKLIDKKFKLRVEAVFKDRPRSGAPPKFKPEEHKQIVALACENPRDVGYLLPHWTHERLAQAVRGKGIVASISPSQVGRILKKGGRPTA